MPLMNDDQLGQWILRRLGAPMLKVELTKEHLDDAIEFAKRWFAAKKGLLRYFSIPYATSENRFDLTTYLFDPRSGLPVVPQDTWATGTSYVANDVVTYGSGSYVCLADHTASALFTTDTAKWIQALPDIDVITDVTFTSQKIDMSILAGPFILPDQQIPYNLFGTGASGGLYSNYIQTIQHIKMAKKALGAESDWRQEGRVLYIFPPPYEAGTLLITYASHSLDLTQVRERDSDLIKRYALARAKLDLGRVRSKYGETPTAQGSTSLDGDKLLEEGNTEIEALDEEIGQSAYPMGFIVGAFLPVLLSLEWLLRHV